MGEHTVKTVAPQTSSACEGVGEQKHQGHHKAVDSQGLHESEGEQQGAADLAFSFGLTSNTFNSTLGSAALTDTRANCSQTNGQTSSDNGSCGSDGIHVECV